MAKLGTLQTSLNTLSRTVVLWNSTGLGTLGRMAIYWERLNPYGVAVADSHVTVIRPLHNKINSEYLFAYFSTRVRDKNFMFFNQAKDIEYWAAFQGRLIYLYSLVLIPEDKLPV